MTQFNIRKVTACAAAAAALFTNTEAFAQDGFVTASKPYAVPTANSPYTVVPILSVGDQVPETSTPSRRYQMIGIPDGLGAKDNGNGTIDLYMNHELGFSGPSDNRTPIQSEPFVGGPRQRGAFISKYVLSDRLRALRRSRVRRGL